MMIRLVGLFFSLVTFHRSAQAIDTVVVSANESSTPANCPILSSPIDLTQCCSLKTPFKATPLNHCQTLQARWMKDRNNENLCGSMCALGDLVNKQEAFQDFLFGFPTSWINIYRNLPTYLSAFSQCVGKLSSLLQIVPENDYDTSDDPGCQVDLLGFAECFSRQVFLTCPQFSSTKECQAAKDYLNRPCLYSALAQEASPRF